MRLSISLLLVFVLLSSCSVKEDRSDCPCQLTLEYDLSIGTPLVNVGLEAEGYSNRIVANTGESPAVIEVPRGEMKLSVLERRGIELPERGLIRIPLGSQADSLFCSCVRCDCNADSRTVTLATHKQFATIFLHISSEGFAIESVEVLGQVDAFDLNTMSPLEGRFAYALRPDEFSSCSFRIPRQLDSSLVLRIRDAAGRVTDFAAGEKIISAGYDWDEENLRDILLDVDCAEADAGIVIKDWNAVSIEA